MSETLLGKDEAVSETASGRFFEPKEIGALTLEVINRLPITREDSQQAAREYDDLPEEVRATWQTSAEVNDLLDRKYRLGDAETVIRREAHQVIDQLLNVAPSVLVMGPACNTYQSFTVGDRHYLCRMDAAGKPLVYFTDQAEFTDHEPSSRHAAIDDYCSLLLDVNYEATSATQEARS